MDVEYAQIVDPDEKLEEEPRIDWRTYAGVVVLGFWAGMGMPREPEESVVLAVVSAAAQPLALTPLVLLLFGAPLGLALDCVTIAAAAFTVASVAGKSGVEPTWLVGAATAIVLTSYRFLRDRSEFPWWG